jgi:hypothetical protein
LLLVHKSAANIVKNLQTERISVCIASCGSFTITLLGEVADQNFQPSEKSSTIPATVVIENNKRRKISPVHLFFYTPFFNCFNVGCKVKNDFAKFYYPIGRIVLLLDESLTKRRIFLLYLQLDKQAKEEYEKTTQYVVGCAVGSTGGGGREAARDCNDRWRGG